MSKLKIFKLPAIIVFTFLFATGIFSQTTAADISGIKNNQTENIVSAENADDLIHIGDLIDVDVVGSSEYDWRGNLTPEGFLNNLNLTIEPVYGLCRTTETVAREIAEGYAKILRDPQIVVKIIDRTRRPVALLYGAVKTPQRFQIKRPVRLNELLILSGGLTDKVSGDIQILRSPQLSCATQPTPAETQAKDKGNIETDLLKHTENPQYINIKIGDLLRGEPESNPLILTGDIVTVLEAKPVYVMGGVVTPKQINARLQLSVSRAIAAAGGLTKNADAKDITIFRMENKESKAIHIDLDKIKSGQADDLKLRGFDIVEVAQKGRKKKKYVPFAADNETDRTDFKNLPLRIID